MRCYSRVEPAAKSAYRTCGGGAGPQITARRRIRGSSPPATNSRRSPKASCDDVPVSRRRHAPFRPKGTAGSRSRSTER